MLTGIGAATTVETTVMINLRSILLPVDFSSTSEQATLYALELAKTFGSQIELLHVIEDPIVYLPLFESYPGPTREQFETYAQTCLENWIPEGLAPGIKIDSTFRHGRPDIEIVDFASDSAVDLIVIGTHGRGMATHLLLGSVAEKVVRKANCPVLTIRTK